MTLLFYDYETQEIKNQMKVFNLVTELAKTGGTQRVFSELLSDQLVLEALDNQVLSLMELGDFEERLQTLDIKARALGLIASRSNFSRIFAFLRVLKEFNRPDLIISWDYHSNLVSIVASLYFKRPVIWNVRHLADNIKAEKKITQFAILTGSLLSFFPRRIIYNSEISMETHERIGYNKKRGTVISNGFDTNQYKPSVYAYKDVREELQIPQETILVGLFCRYHPIKGHKVFISASSLVVSEFSQVHFLLIGNNVVWENHELSSYIPKKMQGKFHLLGFQKDMSRYNAALDIAVNTSFGESFSNSIGEAMASGVPCVVSDVGDSKSLVGESGFVIDAGDVETFSKRIVYLVEHESIRKQMGKKAREIICEEYSHEKMVSNFLREISASSGYHLG